MNHTKQQIIFKLIIKQGFGMHYMTLAEDLHLICFAYANSKISFYSVYIWKMFDSKQVEWKKSRIKGKKGIGERNSLEACWLAGKFRLG